MNEKIGFVGCGNMGSAILEGLLKNKIAARNHIFIFDPVPVKLRALHKQFSIQICKNNEEVIQKSSIVILAIKPQELGNLSRTLKSELKNKTVVSILAGTPIAKVKKLLGNKNTVARAMPNLSAKVGESMTAIAGDPAGITKAKIIFSGCGEVIQLPEAYFDLFTAVSGSGPAYFFFLMELLASYLQKNGVTSGSAKQMAVQTAFGAAKLAKISHEHPEILRKQVTSRGGTTEAALSVLFSKKVPQIFNQALAKAVRRAKELSRG